MTIDQCFDWLSITPWSASITILRNVIIKDEPVSCPFCLGQCRTQICCKAQKEAENNENAISTSVIVLGSIVIALVLIFVLVGALLYHFKSWKNLKAKVAVAKRLVCCKGKGYKGRGGQRGGRVGNIGPVRNVWQMLFSEKLNSIKKFEYEKCRNVKKIWIWRIFQKLFPVSKCQLRLKSFLLDYNPILGWKHRIN